MIQIPPKGFKISQKIFIFFQKDFKFLQMDFRFYNVPGSEQYLVSEASA